jgi:Xaa-Pro dipeptidase
MAVTTARVAFSETRLSEIQRELGSLGLDCWLLYDFRGNNPIASAVLGLPALSRRFFVLIPVAGRPVAITHRIEQQPWEGWIGDNRVYLSWESLDRELHGLLSGRGKVALEYSPLDAVPYVDRVPAGVLEMVARTGAVPVSSADLVTAAYSRWSPEGEASHRRAAVALRDAAHEAFGWIGERIAAGVSPTEWEARDRIVRTLRQEGIGVGTDAVVAVNANAANPHYAPSAEGSAPIRSGDLVLVDLWGKEDEQAIYADQTWMAFVGSDVPERIETLWRAVRDARDQAVDLISTRHRLGEAVAGYEVDVAARDAIRRRGYAEAFLHRTGHSIDRELHGSGPNIDNLETRDTRRLIPGIGFSIEPGIYLPGEFGLRTEIDVYMSDNGPQVTTPDPQREIYRIVLPSGSR